MMTDTTTTTTAKPALSAAEEALAKFTSLVEGRRFEPPYTTPWPGLYFTPGGVSRLALTAGWIAGLASNSATRPLALKLAESLEAKLQYLLSYGGMEERPGPAKGYVKSRRFLVVLGDDGMMGGFTVTWYSWISPERLAKIKEDKGDDFYAGDYPGLTRGDVIPEQERALQDVDGSRIGWIHVAYTFWISGGLLLHGMGKETFAVDISGDSGPHWSIHT